MKILVSNDDGIDAQGIQILTESLKTIADVVVVAPKTEQSAVGHSVKTNRNNKTKFFMLTSITKIFHFIIIIRIRRVIKHIIKTEIFSDMLSRELLRIV